MLELLGVEKPHTELLVDALIGAACRLRLDDELERALCAGACRTSAKIGKSAGRWRYWATSSHGSASSGAMRQRAPRAASIPASRSLPHRRSRRWTGNRQQRLTRLAPTPTKNTAFYIYDWLIGLQTLLAENAATESALGEAQRAALEGIVATLR